jgi:hypothetical protein
VGIQRKVVLTDEVTKEKLIFKRTYFNGRMFSRMKSQTFFKRNTKKETNF